MLKDITIGQYYPAKSIPHGLDPRTKITFSFLFMVGLFTINNYLGYALFGVLTMFLILISKVPIKFLLKGLKPLLIIIVLTFFMHLIMTPGETVLTLGPMNITAEGINQGVFLSLRLILLILVTSLLTLTTTPIALTDGIERILNPLKRVGLSPHELAMMMSISLRFIPTLIEETEKIIKAQKARGAEFEKGNLVQRAKNMVPLFVPLFISAFRRAEELAMAMESRCYRGGENRTRMKELNYSQKDYISYAIGFSIVLMAIIVRFSL